MKRILITGASSGIGAATALHLDRCGMEVYAAMRAPGDGGDALAAASDRLRRITLDVTDSGLIGKSSEDVAATIEQALTDGRPDTRYVVGASGRPATALRPLIPDLLAAKLAERA